MLEIQVYNFREQHNKKFRMMRNLYKLLKLIHLQVDNIIVLIRNIKLQLRFSIKIQQKNVKSSIQTFLRERN